MKLLIKQFIKFSVVGGVSTVIDVGVYYALTRGIDWFGTDDNYFFANFISFGLAATNSYLLNKLWTFRDKDKRIARQAVVFGLITIVGLGISQLFVWGGDMLLGSDLLGKIIGVGGTVIWNFTANRLWTFKKRPEQIEQSNN